MSPAPYYADASVSLYLGDCLDVLAGMGAGSVDAVVTDPPYGLGFMGKEWDDIPPGLAWGQACLRVLKPGGYLLAFGGSRTWHRLATAVEDAGFEIRDSIAWLYGSGFPKSLDVSKAIDKAAGAEREVVGTGPAFGAGSLRNRSRVEQGYRPTELNPDGGTTAITAPATPDAERWQGWGTALKPAFEPIVVGRKPLAGTVAANVLTHGTGALNIDATRIATSRGVAGSSPGDSTACTCPEPEGAQRNRTPSTSRLASSATSLADQSDPLASAPTDARDWSSLPDSPGGYLSSRRCGGERVLSEEEGVPTSAQPLRDAPVYPGPCATCGRIPAGQSTAWAHSTAGNVEREATRSGEASADRRYTDNGGTNFAPLPGVRGGSSAGRWPTNVVLDDTQAAALDEQTGVLTSGAWTGKRNAPKFSDQYGEFDGRQEAETPREASSGGASRFFPTFHYEPKAPQSERPRDGDTAHPTVKPLDLMRWLVRLVTPPGGLVLDPFLGSGTTAEACVIEGFRCIGIEREPAYLPLAVARLSKPIAPVLDFGESA